MQWKFFIGLCIGCFSILSSEAQNCYPTVTIEILRPSNGPGSTSAVTGSPAANPPDFIVNRSWLETVGGVEQYVFAKTDEVKMKAQFKNIGTGEIANDAIIQARAYLSKGYKEDSHNEWVRVGTDEIRGDSLDVGETHTETEGLKLWERSDIKPGKTYNIVWCIDRIADQNNGIGAWPERYESNNCSTETVFTVSGTFDFRITSIALGEGKIHLMPGEVFSVDVTAHNSGDSAPKDTRVGYYLSGGELLNRVLLGTDNITEENFGSGVFKSETLSYAVAPLKPASYTLEACADYDNRVGEIDEENNCSSIVFQVTNPDPPAVHHINPAVYRLLVN